MAPVTEISTATRFAGLSLENMAKAHGREPCQGTGRVIVAMVEPYSDPNNPLI